VKEQFLSFSDHFRKRDKEGLLAQHQK